MADISKITPPGSQTTYNLKDATARTATQWLDKLNGSKNLISVYTFERASMNADVQSDGCTVRVHGTGSGVDLTYGTFTVPETGEYSALISIRSGTVTSLFLRTESADSFDLKNVTTPTSMGTLTQGTVYELKTWTGSGATVDFTVSILICKTGILESGLTDFRPPTLSNTKITPELVDLVDSGAKNELHFTLSELQTWNSTAGTGATWSGNVCTVNGIAFTVNSDGTITANGTLTSGQALFRIMWNAPNVYGGKFLSGCPSGGSTNDYGINIEQVTSPWRSLAQDYGKGGTISNNTSTNIYGYIAVKKSVSNLTFKPMICTKAAWDVSQKFVPYRPTYEETVEQVAENENNISLLTPTVKDSGNAFTVGTDYTLVDACTLTVPIPTSGVKCAHILAGLAFNSTAPRGIIISLSNDISDFNTSSKLLAKVESSDFIRLKAECFYYNYGGSNVNIYVWAKSSTSGVNRVVSSMQLLN